MPLIETTGIRPIDRRQMPGGPETIRRQDDGSGSAFRPQTNVSLKTAIQDMAATLGKISSEEKFGIQKLPQEVGDVVKNILRQSLSVEATLARGIGSTVESQRFSADQLMLFSRMLSQVGMLVEKGYSMELSDETQTLLSNLKSAVVSQEGGENFEPVLMSKASFELVDAKTAEQLPQALYEVLSQLAQIPAATQQQPQAQSDGMQFLIQLVKFFMPRPGVDVPAEEQPPPQQGQLPHQPPSATQRFLNSMFRNFGGRFSQPQAQTQSSTGQPQAQTQSSTGQPQPQSSTGQPQAQAQPSTGQPQAQTQSSTSQPQAHAQSSTSQPQAQTQSSTSQQQAQAQSSTGQPQAQPQPSTGQPQAQAQSSTPMPQNVS
ncbi:MAG: hypothetical protein IJS69_03735, partial [Selenomonadaceae bacterium]|nr:hypothetical protein [Selenomonadaceae bacterium]